MTAAIARVLHRVSLSEDFEDPKASHHLQLDRTCALHVVSAFWGRYELGVFLS
jgi:hypothetical protein